jgi:hypothetical protein
VGRRRGGHLEGRHGVRDCAKLHAPKRTLCTALNVFDKPLALYAVVVPFKQLREVGLAHRRAHLEDDGARGTEARLRSKVC